MSTTFYGTTADEQSIALEYEDPAWLNLANVNAWALLELLRIQARPQWDGRVTVPEARRAVMYARATFARRAPEYVRSRTALGGPGTGTARCLDHGIDEECLALYLERFERFLNRAVSLGATRIYWE